MAPELPRPALLPRLEPHLERLEPLAALDVRRRLRVDHLRERLDAVDEPRPRAREHRVVRHEHPPVANRRDRPPPGLRREPLQLAQRVLRRLTHARRQHEHLRRAPQHLLPPNPDRGRAGPESSRPPARASSRGASARPRRAAGGPPARAPSGALSPPPRSRARGAQARARSDHQRLARRERPSPPPTCAMTSNTSDRRCGSIARTRVRRACDAASPPADGECVGDDPPEENPPAAARRPALRRVRRERMMVAVKAAARSVSAAAYTPALRSARGTTPSCAPPTHRSHASWARMSPGLARLNHSTSTETRRAAAGAACVDTPVHGGGDTRAARADARARTLAPRRSFPPPDPPPSPLDRRTMGKLRATVGG